MLNSPVVATVEASAAVLAYTFVIASVDPFFILYILSTFVHTLVICGHRNVTGMFSRTHKKIHNII